jgi:large subunit ribosomal protein L25
MAEIPLVAESGRSHGTAESRRLRAAGKVPAVVYGHGIDPISIAVDGRALRTAFGTASGTNALLRLEIGETHHLALAREIQRHPVRHTVSHVDFQVVSRDEIVHAEVTLTLVGEAAAVVQADGSVDQELFTLAVKAKPGDLPSHLEIEVAGLAVGDIVRLSELKLPEGVATDLDPETVLVVAHPPKGPSAEELEAGAEAAEAEAAGEGAGTAETGEGAAAADGAPAGDAAS